MSEVPSDNLKPLWEKSWNSWLNAIPCGEGACSRWAAKRPQDGLRGIPDAARLSGLGAAAQPSASKLAHYRDVFQPIQQLAIEKLLGDMTLGAPALLQCSRALSNSARNLE
ncbi:hypothetical protein AO064_28260 [Pseudomonas marginalis]|uniref:Uncharacterized protein n=1 Tax=Pseudomonas marginalis TaxID=298 RepID=A0A9X5KSM6_PSEMA|nr:hypothetical protein AO064_28260 [Pseudomonas marginalis]